MPERLRGLALPPSPACTSARQRPRASPKSDSGSGTGFAAPPDFARLAILTSRSLTPASAGAFVLSVEAAALLAHRAPPGKDRHRTEGHGACRRDDVTRRQ